jgi:hypothetical protein
MLEAELGNLVIGVDATPEAAEATVKLVLADGLLTSLLRNASDTQPILKATKDQPLLMLSGQFDPAAYLKVLDLMMRLEGDDPAEMREEMKEALGFEFDKVVGALTGEAAWAVTGDISAVMKADDPQSQLGGAVIFGLKDVEVIKALVAAIAARKEAGELVKWDADKATLTVTIPKFKEVQVTFSGDRVIASTDMGVAERIAGGNPKLKALLERKDLAAVGMMQQSFAGMWLMVGRSAPMPDRLPDNPTAEMKAKAEELAKLEAEIAPLRASVEEARMKPACGPAGRRSTRTASPRRSATTRRASPRASSRR